MYHATDKNAPILKQGLLSSSVKRKNFGASDSGYTYLATSPKMAEMFGSMAFNNNFTIYEAIVPVGKLLPDSKRLQLTALDGAKSKGSKLAQSLVYASSAKIKGNIEHWQIKKYETNEVITIDQVQSHTNDRCVAISVKAAKLTARLLAQAMRAFRDKSRKAGAAGVRGEQSLKSLTKSGASIENVEIPAESDINSFKKTARKYNIDFALKKDTSTDPPSWMIFFKSKDAKSMDAAFKEFSKNVLDKAPAAPIAKELERFKDIAKGVIQAPHEAGKDKGITPISPVKGKITGDIEI